MKSLSILTAHKRDRRAQSSLLLSAGLLNSACHKNRRPSPLQAPMVPHNPVSASSPQAIGHPSRNASDCSSTSPGKEDSPWADEDPALRVRAANLLVRVLIAFATPRWRQTEIRLRQ